MRISNFSTDFLSFINYIYCTEEQLLTILHYRNMEEITKWMTNTDHITKAQHLAFVEKLRASDSHLYFGVYKDKQYVGSIYLVKNEKSQWFRGLYIIPEFQRLGLTIRIEHAMREKVKLEGIREIYAEVKNNNIASIKFHEKSGYTKLESDAHMSRYVVSIV